MFMPGEDSVVHNGSFWHVNTVIIDLSALP